MQSSMISKIEKARRYAQEPDRVSLTHFTAQFRGEHDAYQVEFDEGKWHCGCNFFSTWGVCSHTMATERILGDRISKFQQADAVPRAASA